MNRRTLGRNPSNVATLGACSNGDQGRTPRRSSDPVVSAPVRAPGGSLPPLGLLIARRTARPPGRIAGRLDGDGQRPRRITRLPVQRRAGRRSVPGGSATSAPATASPGTPCRRGRYDIQVIVKDGYGATTGESATASYTAESRVAGSARGQSHVQPPGRPVQRAALPRRLRCTSSSPDGLQPVLELPPRCPSCRGRAPTSSWRACCPTRRTS